MVNAQCAEDPLPDDLTPGQKGGSSRRCKIIPGEFYTETGYELVAPVSFETWRRQGLGRLRWQPPGLSPDIMYDRLPLAVTYTR